MKMSDRFDLPLKFKSTPFLKDNSGESPIYSQFVFNDLDDNDRVDRAKYACHAINNHDRMVEEIAELKGALESLHHIALLGDFGDEVYSGTLLESDVLKLLNQEGEE